MPADDKVKVKTGFFLAAAGIFTFDARSDTNSFLFGQDAVNFVYDSASIILRSALRSKIAGNMALRGVLPAVVHADSRIRCFARANGRSVGLEHHNS